MNGMARLLGAGALVVSGIAVDRVMMTSDSVAAVQGQSAPVAADSAAISAFTKVSPAVVQVVSVGVGTGSGVIYDTRGDIVTNNHVVQGATKLQVRLVDGRTLAATLVGVDPVDDLAVIHVSAANLPAATFGDSHMLRTAQTVLAIGNPLGLQQTVTEGLVSATGRTVAEGAGRSAYLPDAIQTSAPINPGNSGGALVALDGTVVGIPTLQATDPRLGTAAQGIGFAVSSARVKDVVPQIIAHGKVLHTGRAYLGVALADAASSASPFDNSSTTSTQQGALVGRLSASGPAARGGLKAGDVIVAIDKVLVASRDDVLAVMAQHKPGDKVAVTVQRNGTSLHFTVTLGELPAS